MDNKHKMNTSNKLLSDLVSFRSYAQYIPHLARRESYEETVNRCMVMHLERFPKLSSDITKAFALVHDNKIAPSMRSMQFAGTAIAKNNLRLFNCFGGEERILTSLGVKALKDLKDQEVEVLSPDGKWVSANVKCFGEQTTVVAEFGRAKSRKQVRVTLDHDWVLPNGNRIKTKDLQEGQKLGYRMPRKFVPDTQSVDYKLGVIHGLIYGDGSSQYSQRRNMGYQIRLCRDHQDLLPYFEGYSRSFPPTCNGEPIVSVRGGFAKTQDLKSLPDKSETHDYLCGFFRGYMAADGSITSTGQITICCGEKEESWLKEVMPKLGYDFYPGNNMPEYTNFGKRGKVQRVVGIVRNTVCKEDFLIGRKADRFTCTESCTWVFKGVIPGSERVEPVYCATVPETHSFVLENGLITGNCSYRPIDDVRTFAEILFVLLSGTGLGYSVQSHHVSRLPVVVAPREEGIFFCHDSIQGWAQALDLLMEAYFYGSIRPSFNYSNIRPAGSLLKTTGAKAPGPKPLEQMLETVEIKLRSAIGRRLRPIEVHDIVCIVSDCVLAGGIRRSALISLFDRNDKEMLACKHGKWFEQHPYRARANNSAVLPRKDVTEEEFLEIFKACQDSGSGEPGFMWTNDKEMGSNPCAEISLNPGQLCNLTSVNQTGVQDKRDFLKRIHFATVLGTLQASYTDFHYLRPSWKAITDQEALLGVSFTGIADSKIPVEWLEEGARQVLETNEKFARKIGINVAARTTCLKPEGTLSCVFGSSSGIHARHAAYYLRRFRINKLDSLASYLKLMIPELIEDDVLSPATTLVVTLPQESPPGAILRADESALQLFDRAITYNTHWVHPGHRSGPNYNNVSCSLSVKEQEWDDLATAMWKQRKNYTGISLFPYDGGTYRQAPFEEVDEEKYKEISKLVKEIDFKEIRESTDQTARTEVLACSANGCEIT